MTPEEKAKKLVEDGYEQISRKYRTLARLPEGMTGIEALRSADPFLAQRFLDNAERAAKEQYMRVYSKAEDRAELTVEEFNAYLKATGRGPCHGE